MVKTFETNVALATIAIRHRGKDLGNAAITKLLSQNGGLIYVNACKFAYNDTTDSLQDIISVCKSAILKALDTYKLEEGGCSFITWWVMYMRASVQAWKRSCKGGVDDGDAIVRLKDQLKFPDRQVSKKRKKIIEQKIQEIKTRRNIGLQVDSLHKDGTYELDLKKQMLESNIVGDWTLNGAQEENFSGWINALNETVLSSRAGLTDLELDVIILIFESNMSLRIVGAKLGFSAEYVRLVRDKALGKLEKIIISLRCRENCLGSGKEKKV